MNVKMFYSCLITVFGMLMWMMFQPGSLTFIGIRTGVAFLAALLMLFSITWNDKKMWGKTALIILGVLSFSSLMYFAFTFGAVNYPKTTMILVPSLIILLAVYITYIEKRLKDESGKKQLLRYFWLSSLVLSIIFFALLSMPILEVYFKVDMPFMTMNREQFVFYGYEIPNSKQLGFMLLIGVLMMLPGRLIPLSIDRLLKK